MRGHRFVALLLIAISLSAPVVSGSVRAQDDGPITVAAAGLVNPRGFTWTSDGTLVVAEAGAGGETLSETETAPPPAGPYRGGATAAVVSIANGCPTPLATGLPSALAADGGVIGAADVAQIGDTLFALVPGGGPAHGNAEQPAGLYRLEPDGSALLVADLGRWLRANPVAESPVDLDPEGIWADMVAAPDGSALWIAESNSGQLIAVTPDGEIRRVADLSAGAASPTAIAVGPDGAVYVALSGAPDAPAGAATVVQIAPDGTATDVWTELTAVSGLAVGPDATLFAIESTERREDAPLYTRGTGRLLRQTGPDTLAEVVTRLDLPSALAIGPDGALYVSTPAIGADAGDGLVIRVSPPGDGAAVRFDPRSLAIPACDGEPVAQDGTGGQDTTAGQASGDSTTIADDGTGGGDGGDLGAGPAVVPASDVPTEIILRIYDFGFDPPSITIPAGSTVMWFNTGATQHTTTATLDGSPLWDSGPLDPGGLYQVTFLLPGTYTYQCSVHPEMTATMVVE